MMLRGSNYDVLEVIHDSGSKLICRCLHTFSREKVLLKVLRAELSTHEDVMKFKNEYNMLLDLSKRLEGAAQPIRLEEVGGAFIIVLEDMEGQSLRSLLEEQRLSQETLLRLAIQLVETVGSLHDNQIILKDLNPSTMMCNVKTGRIQLLDLHLAVKHIKEKKQFQNSGFIEGTLPYISPEQTGRINRDIDYRSDFYALGVIFYEMFTGTVPHESGTVMDEIYSIIAKQPVSPQESTQGNVSQPLSDIIMKLLDKSPENRYRSAYGIRADLRKCLASRASFPLGEEDKLNLFHISQKLYGREKELQHLKDAFQDSVMGQSRMVLVSGEAGIGKTALVSELHSFISQERGYFIQGKFDQYNKNLPYSALIQAFRTLLAQLLDGDEEKVFLLRHSLLSRLGTNGGLMVNMIPELQRLIGDQPPVEPLNPTEESNRFFLSFVQFVEGFTNNEKPMVLFLDDLQWADLSSIHLLEKLVGNTSLKKLLVIGSYRDDEVTNGHPFIAAVNEIEKFCEVKRIDLNPLSSADVSSIIQDTFNSSASMTQDLTDLIYNTTKGNPFFVNEMLKDCYKNKAVWFDEYDGAWRLAKSKIRDMTMSDSIIHYLMKKIGTLPDETLRILSLSASIGQSFDWKMLYLVSEEDSGVLAKCLIRAVRADIILPLSKSFHVMAGIGEEEHKEGLNGLELQFAFQHDKIQQALYQMIDLETRKRLHLKIGRLLLTELSPVEVEEKIIEIANNMNKGLEFVTGKDEINKIIDINLKSARKVKDAFGYDTAFEFLGVAISLLSVEDWTINYHRTSEIYRLYCECAYLTHRLEEADQACAVLIQRVQDRMELAGIYEMQANHYTYLGMMRESMEAGKLGLRSLGVKVPAKVSMVSVMRELIKVKLILRGKTTEELLAGPEMKDDRIKLMMRLLVSFIPPAFISGEHNLFGWVVLKKAYLSAKYGNGPESAGAYIGYAILLSGLGDLKGARDFGRLAVKINEKFDDVQWRSLVYVLYTLFCHSWSYSWDTLEEWYKKAIDSSLRSGDLLYLAHASYYRDLWNPSMEIERYLQESDRTLSMIENTGYKESLATAKLAKQKFLSLAGELDNPLSLDSGDFREAEYLKQLTDARYYSGIAIYYVTKIQLSYTFEHYKQSLEYMKTADKYIGTLAGSAFMEEYTLYTFLSLASCYNELSLKDKLFARIRMRKEYARMSKWAHHCPDNFLQQQYMMKAEWARIVRKADVAEAYYNLAIQTSGKGSFIRYKALSNELAAKFYYSRDRNEIAAYYFRQASYYYSVWGAKGKIDQLERDYGELQGLVNRATVVPDKISAPSSDDIDVHSILMASEAISKEIGLDRLLETLMRIVIVNAGAQRGCIVMKSSSSILVEGEYQSDEDLITVKMHDSSVYDHYPRSIIAAAADSQETMIYDDAGSETSFIEDVYMEMYKPKSLLCMPLMNQSKVTAIIYLENNLVTGAFTKERIRMINLLSREMVNSLENASLYTNLERLVAERTEELAYKNEQLNKYIDIVDKNVIIIQTDSQGVITAVSEEFCKSSGYQQEELLGQPHRFLEPSRDLDHPDHEFVEFDNASASAKVWKGELVQLTKDGSNLWLDMAVESVWDQGQITGYTWIGHNITDKKRIEQNSITDDLTGLYNRRYFKDVMWREVKRAARNEDYLTFILLDIDNYKKYNDTYGHYEGDLVLHRIGLTINEQLRRATDYAFRLGGEEFGVVYSGADAEHSYGFAEKIRRSIEALNIPHEENDTSSCVTVSVGLAVVAVKDNQMNEEMIYKLADEALYRSKARGKNCVTMNVL